jgi:hypothetical protein
MDYADNALAIGPLTQTHGSSASAYLQQGQQNKGLAQQPQDGQPQQYQPLPLSSSIRHNLQHTTQSQSLAQMVKRWTSVRLSML